MQVMAEENLDNRWKQVLLGVVATLGVVALLVMLWPSVSGGTPGGPKLSALCSNCGYFAEGASLKLESNGVRAAMAPSWGPGFKCPKCGQSTFYAKPFTCQKCKTRFLLSLSAAGVAIGKCPKCGWTTD